MEHPEYVELRRSHEALAGVEPPRIIQVFRVNRLIPVSSIMFPRLESSISLIYLSFAKLKREKQAGERNKNLKNVVMD